MEEEGNITPRSHAKEGNHKITKNSRPRVEEDQSIDSQKFQTLYGKGKEHQSCQITSNLEQKRIRITSSPKILNLARNRGRISGIIVVKNLE